MTPGPPPGFPGVGAQGVTHAKKDSHQRDAPDQPHR